MPMLRSKALTTRPLRGEPCWSVIVPCTTSFAAATVLVGTVAALRDGLCGFVEVLAVLAIDLLFMIWPSLSFVLNVRRRR